MLAAIRHQEPFPKRFPGERRRNRGERRGGSRQRAPAGSAPNEYRHAVEALLQQKRPDQRGSTLHQHGSNSKTPKLFERGSQFVVRRWDYDSVRGLNRVTRDQINRRAGTADFASVIARKDHSGRLAVRLPSQAIGANTETRRIQVPSPSAHRDRIVLLSEAVDAPPIRFARNRKSRAIGITMASAVIDGEIDMDERTHRASSSPVHSAVRRFVTRRHTMRIFRKVQLASLIPQMAHASVFGIEIPF